MTQWGRALGRPVVTALASSVAAVVTVLFAGVLVVHWHAHVVVSSASARAGAPPRPVTAGRGSGAPLAENGPGVTLAPVAANDASADIAKSSSGASPLTPSGLEGAPAGPLSPPAATPEARTVVQLPLIATLAVALAIGWEVIRRRRAQRVASTPAELPR